MIYPRRALQRRLDELRNMLEQEAVDGLVTRLNRVGRDRTAAMWEAVVLHGLSRCGIVRHEMALTSGRRPDIAFEHEEVRFTADVASVSDDGLDDENPYRELKDLIENAKRRLGLPSGGLDLIVQARNDRTKRGTRTILMLPPRARLQDFVREEIVPRLREQVGAGRSVLQLAINDGGVGLEITIDTAGSRYSTGRHAAYDVPKIKDRNPLYNALKGKAGQLRASHGLAGVIVGDGDCVALSGRSEGWDEVSAGQIVDDFFRQFSSVDFVLLLSVRESQAGWQFTGPWPLRNTHSLHVRRDCSAAPALDRLFHTMMSHLPTPAMTPANGALRARELGYDLGHHGAYRMSDEALRMSLRELTEVLAGLRTLQDNAAKNSEGAFGLPGRASFVQAAITRHLREGRLPASIEIIKTGENDNDDWVEIRFGGPDPAVAPFR